MFAHSATLISQLIKKHITRSSHRRCTVKKGVLRNFAESTGRHLCQSLFFNKVAGLGLQLYWKRDRGTGVVLWILRNHNYFCSVSLITAFSISWNKYDEVVTLEIAILCKKAMVREGTRDREFLTYPLIYSNKLAYFQLISVLERVNEFSFRTCNLTKNELFLRFFWTFSRILFKSFRGLLLQNTS